MSRSNKRNARRRPVLGGMTSPTTKPETDPIARAEDDGMPPLRDVGHQDTSAQDVIDRALDECAGWLDAPVLTEEYYAEAIRTAPIWEDLEEIVDDSEAVLTVKLSPFTANEEAKDKNCREPNFRDSETGKFQLVRCFHCRPEGRGNLIHGTRTGICNWCGARSK